jgi:hypothetical protein
MKSKIAAVLCLVALVTFIAWTVNAQKRSSPKTTWEYKIERDPDVRTLNQLGLLGWEVTGVSGIDSEGNTNSVVVYLKRAN